MYVVGEDDYSVVGLAYADFVLGAYHSERFHPAYLGFLYSKLFVTVIECCAYGGHYYGLSGGYVGRTTDNLCGCAVAEVYGGYVEMVAVGVGFAYEHFAHDYPAEASAYGFDTLH